jgi:hypothetical protein
MKGVIVKIYALTVVIEDRSTITIWDGDKELVTWPLLKTPEVDSDVLLTRSVDYALEMCAVMRVIPQGLIGPDHMNMDYDTLVIGVVKDNYYDPS